jgi:hypothetical protein
MKTASKAALAAGVGVAVTLSRRMVTQHKDGPGRDRDEHWLAVTVYCSPDQVGPPGALPEPLAVLGDSIELRIRPAAGDKGTELFARPRGQDVSREDLRMALRKAKSLIETGDVIQPDTPPSTHPGPAGRVLQVITRLSRGEGRL